MKTPPQDSIEKMYCQVKPLDLGLLLAGVTVLAKDTADYIHTRGFTDNAAGKLRAAYLALLNHDRQYWERFGPGLYLTLKEAALPDGIVKGDEKGEFDLTPLLNPKIEKEWTRAPGWYFFKIYSLQIKDDILRGTKLEDLQATFCDDKEPHKPLVNLIEKLTMTGSADSAGTGRATTRFWYPLLLYIALVLKRTHFRSLAGLDSAE